MAPMKLMTVAPHAVEAQRAAGGEAAVEVFTPELRPEDLVVRVCEHVDTSTAGCRWLTRTVVVSGAAGSARPRASPRSRSSRACSAGSSAARAR